MNNNTSAMGASSVAWKVIIGVSAPFVVWIVAVGVCTLTWVQRHILYLHKAPIGLGTRLNIPETMGFLKNQVVSFRISTPDGVELYAWLIAPLRVFATEEKQFLKNDDLPGNRLETSATFKLLKSDPESRLIIYFHGNSATIGQARRTEEYKILSSGASDKIFILTFDYRGFGYSTGSPTEEGIILDAISVVRWAIKVACISPNRILLLSQSLGTAVATAVAESFISTEPKVEFAGVILCAAFTAAPNIFMDFALLGIVPLLAPLKLFPPAVAWYKRRYKDSWNTSDRLATLVQKSDRLRLTLFHATGDKVIPWRHCETLFYAAASAASGRELSKAEIDDIKETHDLGEGGWLCKWTVDDKVIKQRIVKYGGHDDIMRWEPVALLVLRSFDLD